MKCRSCGVECFFVPSAKSGKKMILESEPDEGGNVQLMDTPGGRVAVVENRDLQPTLHEVVWYIDHHVRCPSAKRWR